MAGERLRSIDIARIVGVSPGVVRYYSWMGFLPPSELSPGGHHRYTHRHLKAAEASNALTRVFGWLNALPVMRLVHGGEVDKALELVDARHADIDRERREIDAAVGAIQSLLEDACESGARPRRRGPLRVGEAARTIGVRSTTLHYWEQLGLLSPRRDEGSGYRVYDAEQMRRVQIVSILRRGGYEFEDIRPIMDELGAGAPEKVLSVMEERKLGLAEESRLCARATARLWEYVEQYCREQITPLVATPARYWRVREKERERGAPGE